MNTELSIINVLNDHTHHNSDANKRPSNDPNDAASNQRYSNSAELRHRARSSNSRMISDNQSSVEPSTKVRDNTVSWRRLMLLITAVTVHNIPEGMAVGVGFGSIGKTPVATFEKAFNLALGIGLQNL